MKKTPSYLKSERFSFYRFLDKSFAIIVDLTNCEHLLLLSLVWDAFSSTGYSNEQLALLHKKILEAFFVNVNEKK